MVVIPICSNHAVTAARLVDRGFAAGAPAIVDDIRFGITHALCSATVRASTIPAVAIDRTGRRSKRTDIVQARSEDALVSIAAIDDRR